MTAANLDAIVAQSMFRPRTQFRQLGEDHVPFDELIGEERFEAVAVRALSGDTVCVAILAPSGAGKSSMIAWVCRHLPGTHVALRVPVTGVDDPTSVSEASKLTLSTALHSIELEAYQRTALERAQADELTQVKSAPGLTGGKLGGGVVPVEANVELGSLREELRTGRLAGDRLMGLERLVQILVYRGVTPVFVFEDTEAAVGGNDDSDRIEGFFAGPVQAFMQEVDTPCLIAVQDHLVRESPAFRRLAPSMTPIRLTSLGDRAQDAIATILTRRLSQHTTPFALADVLASDALDALVAFYDETGGSLRHVLAAAQSAAEHAVNMSAERIREPHVRVGASDWRR